MYWAVPTSGTRLKVGVPVKEGFTEFVKLKQFQDTAEYNVTGFCADLFRELLVHLPFKIENPQYIPFGDPATGRSAGNYDDLLTQLEEKDGSFVKEMLTKRLNFNVSKIKSYASVEQYHDALFKGCHNGGVDAILDELPFIKIFLDTYGETNYKLQGSSYKTGGIGFAFPKGSALAPHISLALLNLTGSGEMHAIMSKNFGPEYSDSDYSFNSSSQVSSIGTKSLAGLFIISGSMAILALVFSAPWFHQRFSYVSTHYKLSCVYPSPSSDVIDLSVQSALEIRVECPPLLLLRTHSLCQLGAKRTVLLMMRLAKMILTPVQPDPVFTAITRSLQQI